MTRTTTRTTSPPMAPRPRTAGEIASAVAALAVLVALVVGIPTVLLLVAPPGIDVTALPGLLTRPDDGTLFLAALAGIAWLAWAAFTLSVLVEAVAVVRGLPAPRLPGLGMPQRSAAALVGAAAVLLTSNPWHAATAVAAPVAATAPTAAGSTTTSTPVTTPTAKPVARQPEHHDAMVTVRAGDSLWSLAERHLGAGSRYREIAELNYKHRQRDGRTLDHDHWIHPGWTLRLPTDATHTREPDDGTYVVRPGDTLSEVAARELGDAARYPEIARATRPVEQPDGKHLSDPDAILPGWTLRLPETEARHETEAEVVPEDWPVRPRYDPTAPTPTPTPTAAPTETPTSAPAPTSASPSTSNPTPTVSAVEAPSEVPEEIPFPSRLVLGMGGIAAAGFIGTLAARRRRQQSIRQPGEQISMPGPSEALTEATLRAAQEPFTAADIRRALQALAARCAETGRDLPRLLFVRATRESVYLTFAADEPDPPAGFIATQARTWRIGDIHRRTDPDALTNPDLGTDAEADPEVFDPYPALVTLGVTDDDALLIANLEAAGTLTVTGAADATRAVLLALVAELSTSTLSQTAGLTLSGGLQGLAGVHDLTHVQAVDPDRLGYLAGVHRREVVDVLTGSSAVDVHYARSHRIAGDTWTPEVFATDQQVPDVEPWLGTVLIGRSDQPGPGWTITLNGAGLATLQPAGITVDPQHLDDDTYQQLLTLLATADTDPTPVVPVQVTPAVTDPGPAALPALTSPSPPATDSPPSSATAEPAGRVAPRVLVLGPVLVEGADDAAVPSRRRRLTELVAYLALHPGATAHQIDEAIWPGRRVGKQTRNSFVSRARRWLGRTPDGDQYLPLIAADSDYHLNPDITCDWHDFQRLAAEGLAAGQDGAQQLEAALALVRGRPFLGVDPTTYTWAEADTQDMISTIVDAAHSLARLWLTADDHLGAQRAAAQGLLADQYSELLFGDAIEAAQARGDRGEAIRLEERQRHRRDLIDPDGVDA